MDKIGGYATAVAGPIVAITILRRVMEGSFEYRDLVATGA
jgi:hypothetical protein